MTSRGPAAERRVGLWVAAVCGAVFVSLAAALVPWDPVPGGDLRPVDPAEVLTGAEIGRAEDFARWARVWSWSSLAVTLVLVCALGLTRRGRSLVSRAGVGPWWARVVAAVLVVELAGRLLTLPFAVLQRRHFRAHGLTRQSWEGFAADVLRGELVAVVATSLGAVVLVGCARRWARAWPAVAAGLVGALVLGGSYVYPYVVEPLYNSFTSLEDGPLRARILELAAEEGVPVDDVLVADASRRTTTLNAYVSGFGASRRVVVYDNLVEQVPEDQVVGIVAHELAHARHDDVLVGSVLAAAGAGFGIGLLALIVASGRVPRMRDPAVVPAILALVAVGSLLASPVQNGISRRVETRADVEALVATQDAASFIDVQRRLMVRSLADPTPPAWSHFWFGSHPTGPLRVALARRIAAR